MFPVFTLTFADSMPSSSAQQSSSAQHSPAATQSSASPPSTVTLVEEIPGTSTPCQSPSPSASIPSPIAFDQFPGTYCRIPDDNTLHFVFPIRKISLNAQNLDVRENLLV